MRDSKTFRLFISSTFSDFKREREILQTKVFPDIKKYASAQGYSFQPIDLRWGVSNEAQLDQKTLELCLSEVRACKTHIHPNFLIMIGDRYGWVPLPYAIEVNEFEELLLHVNSDEKETLQEWYIKDLNQLPASYILKERTNKYEEFDVWAKVETTLRDILQSAVNKSNLNEEQKRKYFLSATEAEVEEGIIPYLSLTEHQAKLINKNTLLQKMDAQHIFGFFRAVQKNTQVEDKFIGTDYKEEVKNFKKRVSSVLLAENTLSVRPIQKSREELNEKYLIKFQKRVTKFLELQIDAQKEEEKKYQLTELEIELQAQNLFALEKRKNFLAQDEIRETIANYILDENQQSLVIYGESGRGKSALISKAIEEAKKKQQKKVLYRFVGATPNSSSSKEILISIFDELGQDIRSKKEKQQTQEDISSLNLNDDQETFKDFSYRVRNELIKLKEDTVIFIDAVDQLINDDQFLWLPKKLPSNVKIVISALEDEKYQEDSKYIQVLKTKTDNLYLIPEFNEPSKLLHVILEQESRTLQAAQEEYFLQQYEKVKSPLYVIIAAQEIKNWKGSDKSQTLSETQQDIIQEFIENLHVEFHHNREFVQKVLGYIYASRDGLSESELLQLLSVDEAFVKKMAPETWHENPNRELPIIHWSRLQTQLKPFLSSKTQDNEELMYFFHREFEDTLNLKKEDSADTPVINAKVEHESIIKATQQLILNNQDKEFDENRWGKLYATIITEYVLRYRDKEKQVEFAEFMTDTKNLKIDWIRKFINNLANIGCNHSKQNKMNKAIAYEESFLHITKNLYKKNSDCWVKKYIIALTNLATSYQKQEGQLDKAIKLGEESLKILKPLYKENQACWADLYAKALTNLAASYQRQEEQLDKAIKLEEESLSILKELYKDNPVQWIGGYTTVLKNLAASYSKINQLDKAIELQKESLEILKPLYKENPARWAGGYTITLNNLAVSYSNIKQLDKAIKLEEESLEILKQLYKENPSYWAELYTAALNGLSSLYKKQSIDIQLDKAIKLQEESLKIVKELYKEDQARWVENYTRALNNLAASYLNKSQLDRAIKRQEESVKILKPLYKEGQARWAELYTIALGNLSSIYNNKDQFDKAIELQEESLEILKPLYKKNQARWADGYTSALHNLAIPYYNQKSQHQLDKAIELQEESLEILKLLYKENPARWAEKYTVVLYAMGASYHDRKYIVKSLELLEINYKVHKEQYGENDYRTIKMLHTMKIVKMNQHNSKEEATFTDLLYLSKFLSVVNKNDEISVMYFKYAFGFIEFNEKAKGIFAKIDFDSIKRLDNAKQCIEEVKYTPKIPYSEDLKWLVKRLEDIFEEDEVIGVLR